MSSRTIAFPRRILATVYLLGGAWMCRRMSRITGRRQSDVHLNCTDHRGYACIRLFCAVCRARVGESSDLREDDCSVEPKLFTSPISVVCLGTMTNHFMDLASRFGHLASDGAVALSINFQVCRWHLASAWAFHSG